MPLWLAARAPTTDFSPTAYIQVSRTIHISPVCDAAAVLYSQTIFEVIVRDAPGGVFTIADALWEELKQKCPELEAVGKAIRGDSPGRKLNPWVG